MPNSLTRSEYLASGDVQKSVKCMLPYMEGKERLKATVNYTVGMWTLYEAFKGYRWPPKDGKDFNGTMAMFGWWRQQFRNSEGCNDEYAGDAFVSTARQVVQWGGTGKLSKLHTWASMKPENLKEEIAGLKCMLDPYKADLGGLIGFDYMRSGLSNIPSMLVPSLPIYDSRTACALACLIRKCSNGKGPNDMLRFRIPPGRVTGRCDRPGIHSASAYAEDMVKAAGLLGAILQHPGQFSGVPQKHRIYALHFALFMVGYTKLE